MAAIATVIGVLMGAGGAYALVTGATGTFTDRQHFYTNNVAYTVPSTVTSGTWVNVPGMLVYTTVPSGTTRTLVARFTAESMCTGSGYCSVRIVYVTPSGALVEMHPQASTDFAFDSGDSTDRWEGHAIDRNSRYRVGAGTYRVYVQTAKVGSVSTLRLDEMHLTVEQVRP